MGGEGLCDGRGGPFGAPFRCWLRIRATVRLESRLALSVFDVRKSLSRLTSLMWRDFGCSAGFWAHDSLAGTEFGCKGVAFCLTCCWLESPEAR